MGEGTGALGWWVWGQRWGVGCPAPTGRAVGGWCKDWGRALAVGSSVPPSHPPPGWTWAPDTHSWTSPGPGLPALLPPSAPAPGVRSPQHPPLLGLLPSWRLCPMWPGPGGVCAWGRTASAQVLGDLGPPPHPAAPLGTGAGGPKACHQPQPQEMRKGNLLVAWRCWSWGLGAERVSERSLSWGGAGVGTCPALWDPCGKGEREAPGGPFSPSGPPCTHAVSPGGARGESGRALRQREGH